MMPKHDRFVADMMSAVRNNFSSIVTAALVSASDGIFAGRAWQKYDRFGAFAGDAGELQASSEA